MKHTGNRTEWPHFCLKVYISSMYESTHHKLRCVRRITCHYLNQLKSDFKFYPAGLAGNSVLVSLGFLLPQPGITQESNMLTWYPESRGWHIASHPLTSPCHHDQAQRSLVGMWLFMKLGHGECSLARLEVQMPSTCPLERSFPSSTMSPFKSCQDRSGSLKLGVHQSPSLTRMGLQEAWAFLREGECQHLLLALLEAPQARNAWA